eukprot:3630653-Rhodomonas_salina.1
MSGTDACQSAYAKYWLRLCGLSPAVLTKVGPPDSVLCDVRRYAVSGTDIPHAAHRRATPTAWCLRSGVIYAGSWLQCCHLRLQCCHLRLQYLYLCPFMDAMLTHKASQMEAAANRAAQVRPPISLRACYAMSSTCIPGAAACLRAYVATDLLWAVRY